MGRKTLAYGGGYYDDISIFIYGVPQTAACASMDEKLGRGAAQPEDEACRRRENCFAS